MNNKKGFTILEVVLAFTFAVILLTSMFVIVINYQNRVEKEKIVSNLLTYKNGILEIVYHDIISDNLKKMKVCDNNITNCIEIETADDKYKLESKADNQGNKYLAYRDNNYVLPDSKNNLSKFGDFEYSYDENNKIFKVNIPVIHAELEDDENKENTIEIIVSGKEFDKKVTKLENPIVIKAINGLIYDDSNHKLITVQNPKGAVYYSTMGFLDGSNYSDNGTTTIPSKKDAGTYTVYYYVKGNNDYHPKSGSIAISIGKRKITYKANDAQKVYDGTPLTNGNATLISGSLVSGHTAHFAIEGTITNPGEISNILRSVVIRNQSGVDISSNYDITKVNGKLVIELISTTIPTNSLCVSRTYNGYQQQITSITSGTGYTLSGYSRTNAGNHTVTATLTSGYKWSDNTTGTKTFSCNIGKATPTITLNPTSGTMTAGGTTTFTEKANVAGSFSNVSSNTGVATVSPANHNSVSANTEKTVTVTGVENGNSTITVTFTPTDTANYNSATTTYAANTSCTRKSSCGCERFSNQWGSPVTEFQDAPCRFSPGYVNNYEKLSCEIFDQQTSMCRWRCYRSLKICAEYKCC